MLDHKMQELMVFFTHYHMYIHNVRTHVQATSAGHRHNMKYVFQMHNLVGLNIHPGNSFGVRSTVIFSPEIDFPSLRFLKHTAQGE